LYASEKTDEVQVVGGVAAKGHKDFSPEAAKVAHDKPQPTNVKPPHKPSANSSSTLSQLGVTKHGIYPSARPRSCRTR
jgi:hypothetical protein